MLPNRLLLQAALLVRDQAAVIHVCDHQGMMELSDTYRAPTMDLGSQRARGLDDPEQILPWEDGPPWIPIRDSDPRRANEPRGLPWSAPNMSCHLDGRIPWCGRPWDSSIPERVLVIPRQCHDDILACNPDGVVVLADIIRHIADA